MTREQVIDFFKDKLNSDDSILLQDFVDSRNTYFFIKNKKFSIERALGNIGYTVWDNHRINFQTFYTK